MNTYKDKIIVSQCLYLGILQTGTYFGTLIKSIT